MAMRKFDVPGGFCLSDGVAQEGLGKKPCPVRRTGGGAGAGVIERRGSGVVRRWCASFDY